MNYNINFSIINENGEYLSDNINVSNGNETISNVATLSNILSNMRMNRARYYYDENHKLKILRINDGYKLENIWNKLVEIGENKPTVGDKNIKIYVDLTPEIIDLGEKIKNKKKNKKTKKNNNKKVKKSKKQSKNKSNKKKKSKKKSKKH